MPKTFVIDCFATNGQNFSTNYAIVAIDVLRASTTITTAISLGHSVFLAASPQDAAKLASSKTNSLLVGEQSGIQPLGFDLQNSPVQLLELKLVNSTDSLSSKNKPSIVMVSSSGVPLILSTTSHKAGYICCLRNLSAVASHIARNQDKVAIIGAGTQSEFRREDQIGCSLLAKKLKEHGFEPEDESSEKWMNKWSSSDIYKISTGNSAAYLRRSQQEYDLKFTIDHVDDLKVVPILQPPNRVIATME